MSQYTHFSITSRSSILSNIKIASMRLLRYCSVPLMLVSLCITSAHAKGISENTLFVPNPNQMERVLQTIDKAKESNKLAMIVLGAQWCHDSRDFAATMQKPQVEALINADYEINYVDVSFLEDRRDITNRFDYPTYFATPTVLVIDPKSQRLLNRDTLSKWFNASNINDDDYLTYFAAIDRPSADRLSATSQATPALVSEFEAQQSQRLQNAYSTLGPFLRAEAEGTLQNTTIFYEMWTEVREFRMTLQDDFLMLRQQTDALDKQALQQIIQPAGSWESE